MTTVTPIHQSPLLLLQNAVEVCTAYEDKKLISAESAQQQLGRIRGLIVQALACLEEPHAETVRRTALFIGGGEPVDERTARDAAAVITRTALSWGIGDDL